MTSTTARPAIANPDALLELALEATIDAVEILIEQAGRQAESCTVAEVERIGAPALAVLRSVLSAESDDAASIVTRALWAKAGW